MASPKAGSPGSERTALLDGASTKNKAHDDDLNLGGLDAAGATATQSGQPVAAGAGFFGGVVGDIRGRAACYGSDWVEGLGPGLLGPASAIFVASVIPALTFGEQIADETKGEFGGSQVG